MRLIGTFALLTFCGCIPIHPLRHMEVGQEGIEATRQRGIEGAAASPAYRLGTKEPLPVRKAAAPGNPLVSGRVIDEDGRGVRDVTVLAAGRLPDTLEPHEARTRTGYSGSFALPLPPKFSGVLYALLAVPGLQASPPTVALTNVTAPVTGLSIVARIRTHDVSGRICDQDGVPLAGVEVILNATYDGGKRWVRQMMTGADGLWSLPTPHGSTGGVTFNRGAGEWSFEAAACP